MRGNFDFFFWTDRKFYLRCFNISLRSSDFTSPAKMWRNFECQDLDTSER